MKTLTKRERQIAEMIAWGASTKDIANDLFLSVRTVENHVRNIHEKTGLQKSNEIAAWWFCKEYGIDPALSPLKKIIVFVFIGLIVMTEISDDLQAIRTFRSKTRTEVRTGRRRSEYGEFDFMLDL